MPLTMDRKRSAAGLDLHKDSGFLCIMRHDEAIIFEKTYGALTIKLSKPYFAMKPRNAYGEHCCILGPVWNELFEHMSLRLAYTHFIKQLPARKSDTKDTQWIYISPYICISFSRHCLFPDFL